MPLTSKKEREERLQKFLDNRCYEIGNKEEKELMKQIFPKHEGTWGISKESLRNLLSQEISLVLKEAEERIEAKREELNKEHENPTTGIDRDFGLIRTMGGLNLALSIIKSLREGI